MENERTMDAKELKLPESIIKGCELSDEFLMDSDYSTLFVQFEINVLNGTPLPFILLKIEH